MTNPSEFFQMNTNKTKNGDKQISNQENSYSKHMRGRMTHDFGSPLMRNSAEMSPSLMALKAVPHQRSINGIGMENMMVGNGPLTKQD